MRPANKVAHEICEEMEEYGPSFAVRVVEADRAALVAEIVAWLPKQLPHLSLQEYADAIAAKWGARP